MISLISCSLLFFPSCRKTRFQSWFVNCSKIFGNWTHPLLRLWTSCTLAWPSWTQAHAWLIKASQQQRRTQMLSRHSSRRPSISLQSMSNYSHDLLGSCSCIKLMFLWFAMRLGPSSLCLLLLSLVDSLKFLRRLLSSCTGVRAGLYSLPPLLLKKKKKFHQKSLPNSIFSSLLYHLPRNYLYSS